MPQLNKRHREVSPRLNKSKIGFNGAGGVKISRRRRGPDSGIYASLRQAGHRAAASSTGRDTEDTEIKILFDLPGDAAKSKSSVPVCETRLSYCRLGFLAALDQHPAYSP